MRVTAEVHGELECPSKLQPLLQLRQTFRGEVDAMAVPRQEFRPLLPHTSGNSGPLSLMKLHCYGNYTGEVYK